MKLAKVGVSHPPEYVSRWCMLLQSYPKLLSISGHFSTSQVRELSGEIAEIPNYITIVTN